MDGLCQLPWAVESQLGTLAEYANYYITEEQGDAHKFQGRATWMLFFMGKVPALHGGKDTADPQARSIK